MSSNELNEIDQYPDEINIKDLTFALIPRRNLSLFSRHFLHVARFISLSQYLKIGPLLRS